MHRFSTLVALVCIIGATACSNPQVRDDSQLDDDEQTALLEAVCDDDFRGGACGQCPAFLDDANGQLRFERVLYGSFSYDTADEALLEVSGCGGGHAVVALEQRDDQWHRFGFQKDVSLVDCEQVERDNGATGLVCLSPREAHSQRKQTLSFIGIQQSKFEHHPVISLRPSPPCESPIAGNYVDLVDVAIERDLGQVEYTAAFRCVRTMPGRQLCEGEDARREKMTRFASGRRNIDWSLLEEPPAANGCNPSNIQQVIESHIPELEECVALGGEAAQTGGYLSRLKVQPDGTVSTPPTISSAPTANQDVEICFKNVLSNMTFEKPDGMVCIVPFPFYFYEGSYWRNACYGFDPPPAEWLEAQRKE